jgi:hypothetical protein
MRGSTDVVALCSVLLAFSVGEAKLIGAVLRL